MAWLFSRFYAGGRYTDFEIDQPWPQKDTRGGDFSQGLAPLLPDPAIRSATQVKKTDAKVPDIIAIRSRHGCSRRFKDFLEQWEPGIHFFSPIILKRKSGEEIGEFYIWTVGQDIDCILTQDLQRFWKWDEGRGDYFDFLNLVSRAGTQYAYPGSGDGSVIKISRPAVAGRHLWMGGLLGRAHDPVLFMSDQMFKAYRSEKFQFMTLECSVQELDVSWVAHENMGPLLEKWTEREENIRKNWGSNPDRHGGVR